MKTIVALLLLANLGVFVWQTYEKGTGPPPTAVPAQELDNKVNRLPLLDEMETSALREREQGADKNVSAEASEGDPGAVAALRCYTLGPFKPGETTRSGIKTWLESKGATATLSRNERREMKLYWVFFPPAADRKAATARLEELKAKGVEDVQVVPKGDMVNAISLGIYSKPISRDRRLVEMRQKGYQPKVGNRYQAVKADWLDVRVSDESFEPKDFSDQFRGLELTKTRCTTG